ncbi:MAG: hypothetical protein AAGE13_03175 [Pseudomonadota bacterium]
MTQVNVVHQGAPRLGFVLEPSWRLSHVWGMQALNSDDSINGAPQGGDGQSPGHAVPAWLDETTVQPVGHAEILDRGLKHISIAVFVICDGALLVARHGAAALDYPGRWTASARCWPRWSEHYAIAAARHLRGTLGLSGLDLRKCGSLELRATRADGRLDHALVQLFATELDSLVEAPRAAATAQSGASARWVEWDRIAAEAAAAPNSVTPLLGQALSQAGAQLLPHDAASGV